jgi:two-component system, OmpR family, phosphate regulon sensor histidine kinase PhoR
MKKIFTLIIVLISISLLGIIYIQVNWINNMIRVRESQFEENMSRAMVSAGQKLLSSVNDLRNPQSNTLLIDPLLLGGNTNRNFLSRLTHNQIKQELEKAFVESRLKIKTYEYSISSSANEDNWLAPDLHSPGFFDLYKTKNVGAYGTVIYPQSGSPLEGLVPEASILVLIPNVKSTLLRQMGWFLAGALLFTVIIISAFYLTVRTMLKQKKLSEIKSDFINNMTHEFKTPLATISLAVDALKNQKVLDNPEKMNHHQG